MKGGGIVKKIITLLSVMLMSVPTPTVAVILENATEEVADLSKQEKSKELLAYSDESLIEAENKLLFFSKEIVVDKNIAPKLKQDIEVSVTKIKEKNNLTNDLLTLQKQLNTYFSGDADKLARLENLFLNKEKNEMDLAGYDDSEIHTEDSESADSEENPTEEDSSETETFSSAIIEASTLAKEKTSEKSQAAELENNLKRKKEISTEAVVQKAPAGLQLEDVLDKGLGHAQIIKRQSDDTDVVIITDAELSGGRGQTGGIWSTKNMRIDLKKPFKADMSLYFGSSGLDAADGMTFTLHNDPRGTSALGAGGGSLGAYGPLNDSKNFYQKALQNAFTIEFDTHKNEYFDVPAKLTDQHISIAYPHTNRVFKATTWQANSPTKQISQFGNSFLGREMVLHHNRLWEGSSDFFKSSNEQQLANGNWHDVSINYKPPRNGNASEFILTFDGKVANLSREFRAENLGFNLKSPNPALVYWGFTGATGSQSSTNAVVFKEVPGLMELAYQGDITKDGQSIASTKPLTEVPSQTELTYHSELIYEQGNQEMKQPVIKTSTSSHVSYIPNSYEVSLDGGAYEAVPDAKLQISPENIAFKVTHNFSEKPGDIKSLKTRFKVETKDNFDKNHKITEKITFNSKNASYVTEPTSLEFILKKNQYNGRLSLSPLDDNQDKPVNENVISGEIVMRRGFSNQAGVLYFKGDPAIEGASFPITLDKEGKAKFQFKLKQGQFLTATHLVEASFIIDDQLSALATTKVQDKFAPTGVAKSLDYFVIEASETELPPINVRDFFKNLHDTNPTVQESDISVRYVNPQQVLANMKKVGNYQIEFELADPVGNKRYLTSHMRVHEHPLVLETKDVTHSIKTIFTKNSKGQLIIKSDDAILKMLSDKEELRAYYITNEGKQVNLLDKVKVIHSEIQPHAGEYLVELSVGLDDLAIMNPHAIKNKTTTFKFTITDGSLTYNVTNQMNLDVKLQTSAINLPFNKKFQIMVKNERFATEKWQISAKSNPFIDQDKKILPMVLTYHNKGQVSQLTNQEQLIATSNDTNKIIPLDTLNNNQQYFSVKVEADSVNWASNGTRATTTIEWNLASSDDSILKNASRLTKPAKEVK